MEVGDKSDVGRLTAWLLVEKRDDMVRLMVDMTEVDMLKDVKS
jgi:hypothetical protein